MHLYTNENIISTSSKNGYNSNNNNLSSPSLHSYESLSSQEKSKIISQFQKDLKSIDISQITIERIGIYVREKIFKYGDAIAYDLFQLIQIENIINPCLEYVYLVNEIIMKFALKKKFEQIKNELLQSLFPIIKGICFSTYSILDDNIQSAVKDLLDIWDKNYIFPSEMLKEFEFELEINTNPDFKGTNDEVTYLQNLVNSGSFKIDQALIDYSKEIEALNRTKDNKHRKILLKMDKDLINKQLRIYNNQVQNLRDINLLLNKIKSYEESKNDPIQDGSLKINH